MIEDLLILSKKWNYDFFVWNRSSSPWIKFSKMPAGYNLTDREILPNELVLEWERGNLEDNKVKMEQISQSMIEKGLGHYSAFSGNKSIHIHSFWLGLEKLSSIQRKKVKFLLAEWICGKELASQLDSALFGIHLIRPLGIKHPETQKIKMVIDFFKPEQSNSVPSEILEQAIKIREPVLSSVSFKPTKCPFIDYALAHKLPEGNRNNLLFPNAVAILSEKQLSELELVQQDKIGWKTKKPKFSCKQLQKFADETGLRRICDLCLLNRGDINVADYC